MAINPGIQSDGASKMTQESDLYPKRGESDPRSLSSSGGSFQMPNVASTNGAFFPNMTDPQGIRRSPQGPSPLGFLASGSDSYTNPQGSHSGILGRTPVGGEPFRGLQSDSNVSSGPGTARQSAGSLGPGGVGSPSNIRMVPPRSPVSAGGVLGHGGSSPGAPGSPRASNSAAIPTFLSPGGGVGGLPISVGPGGLYHNSNNPNNSPFYTPTSRGGVSNITNSNPTGFTQHHHASMLATNLISLGSSGGKIRPPKLEGEESSASAFCDFLGRSPSGTPKSSLSSSAASFSQQVGGAGLSRLSGVSSLNNSSSSPADLAYLDAAKNSILQGKGLDLTNATASMLKAVVSKSPVTQRVPTFTAPKGSLFDRAGMTGSAPGTPSAAGGGVSLASTLDGAEGLTFGGTLNNNGGSGTPPQLFPPSPMLGAGKRNASTIQRTLDMRSAASAIGAGVDKGSPSPAPSLGSPTMSRSPSPKPAKRRLSSSNMDSGSHMTASPRIGSRRGEESPGRSPNVRSESPNLLQFGDNRRASMASTGTTQRTGKYWPQGILKKSAFSSPVVIEASPDRAHRPGKEPKIITMRISRDVPSSAGGSPSIGPGKAK